MNRLIFPILLAITLPVTAGQAPAQTHLLSFAARFNAFAPRVEPVKKSAGPTLKAAATIVGEIVRIGDLIEHAGAAADVPIFRAPDLGETGTVAVTRVLEAVTPHELIGVDTHGLTEIIVTRASRTVTPEDIERRIVRALAARHHVADPSNVTITLDRAIPTIHIEPDAGTEPRIARIGFEPRSGRFDVVFELPGKTRRLLRFTGSCTETIEAAVLLGPVHAGTVLNDTDFKFVRRPKSAFASNMVSDRAQVVGRAARHPLRAGQILRQSDLKYPELIARNDLVTITYEVPGITLTLRGKALEAGAKGEVIGILNINSKRTIQAMVVGPGHVKVATTGRAQVEAPPARLAAGSIPQPNIHPNAHVRFE